MRFQPSACHIVALGVLLLLELPVPLFAQSRVHPNDQQEMQAREWALTHIPDEVNKHFKKEQISLFEQIRDDFTRLQIINNEMMQAVFVNGKIDRKLITAKTTEINKRAARLSANLALPKINDKSIQQKPDNVRIEGVLQKDLSELDRCIMSFVTNPIFKQPKVVDSENALKARSDLNLIIDLSERLKTMTN